MKQTVVNAINKKRYLQRKKRNKQFEIAIKLAAIFWFHGFLLSLVSPIYGKVLGILGSIPALGALYYWYVLPKELEEISNIKKLNTNL